MGDEMTPKHWTQTELDLKIYSMKASPKFQRFSFAGAVLCNLEIKDCTFFNVNFTGTNMAGCRFTNVKFLGNCRFDRTCMVYCNFKNVIGIDLNTKGLILTPTQPKEPK